MLLESRAWAPLLALCSSLLWWFGCKEEESRTKGTFKDVTSISNQLRLHHTMEENLKKITLFKKSFLFQFDTEDLNWLRSTKIRSYLINIYKYYIMFNLDLQILDHIWFTSTNIRSHLFRSTKVRSWLIKI